MRDVSLLAMMIILALVIIVSAFEKKDDKDTLFQVNTGDSVKSMAITDEFIANVNKNKKTVGEVLEDLMVEYNSNNHKNWIE